MATTVITTAPGAADPLVSHAAPGIVEALPAYGCCDLGSINLVSHVRNAFEPNASFDFASFEQGIAVAVRMLDNVLTATVWPLPQQAAPAGTAPQRRRGAAAVWQPPDRSWDQAVLRAAISAATLANPITSSAIIAVTRPASGWPSRPRLKNRVAP